MSRPRLAALIVVVLVWAALMPPFFTHGACDAEFNRVTRQLMDNEPALGTRDMAGAYFWRTGHLPVRVEGNVLTVRIPVQNRVCSLYRDTQITILLRYDQNGRLRQLQSDMKPYRYLRLPWLGIDWRWGG